MDKRISDRARQLSFITGNGRATVLSVSRRNLLVETDGQRHLIRIEPDEASFHWVGQRIDYERTYSREDLTAEGESMASLAGPFAQGIHPGWARG